MLLTVFGILPIVFAEHWLYPIIGRFFIGAGSSAAILGVFKVIRIVFIEKYFARMLSFSVTLGLIGAIYGSAPINYLYEAYGYQVVVQIIAILGVVLASTSYILIPHAPVIPSIGVVSSLKHIFTNSRVLLVCVLAGCMVGPLEGFADAWGSKFLKEIYNYDMSRAHYIISMIYIGMCCAPVLSLIAEKTDSYIGVIIGAGIIMMATFIILATKQFNMQVMIISFFIVGICCAYQILAIYKASTYVSENMVSLTTAVANMIIMSFGYIFHSTIGIIVKQYNDLGEDKSYIYGVSIIPFMLLIGISGFSILSYRERK
ncbi:MAG: MFS transporter [Rickettsia endosymbiont of Oxypoda opaca]|nr:MFS transporter [Rickettsia endosymbiont of Oxypoda opaca]